ncbi:MAG TPA: hypothetical protein VLL07_05395, partial [Pontiella sp.]|nr:hypothetical protein [Pontiella sp.]
MKVKIAVISGLILACTAVPRAQGDPETGPYLDDAMLPAAPVMYEDAESTNSVIFLMPKNQSFSAWTEGSFKADGIEQFAISNDDRIFLL